MKSYQFLSLLLIFVCLIEFIDVPVVLHRELVDDFVRAVRVLFVQVIGDFNQRIGCARHGRQNNEVAAACNQFCYIFHPLCRSHRSTAKL